MSNRRIVNVSKTSQSDLADKFHWLMDVDNNEQRAGIQILSVSVFDHWLSREEACEKLEMFRQMSKRVETPCSQTFALA